MSRTVSVVVPVKDGARFLPELLDAVLAQGPHEVLVVDSGSADDSVAIARGRGARVHEIAPHEFGHGRTRNLGAELTSGDVIAFLTQDATPLPGWLDAVVAGFGLAGDVGAVYGPHRARPDTSPMIARELDRFFASHAGPDGGPRLQREGDDAYLSNVNAAYRRDCWEQVRFPDVPYSEDQAFARAMLAAGWAKAYLPGMAVLHAHDYPPVQFMRRYFDEYRGLRETIGHVEGLGAWALGHVRGEVAADRAWLRERGASPAEVRRWTARSLVHHGGRRVFSALGSRAHGLPPAVQRRISLEGTAATADPGPTAAEREAATGALRGERVAATHPVVWDPVRRLRVEGPADLLPVPDALLADDASLHVAVVIPPFERGSGGHNSVFQLTSRLERAGHTVTYWLEDPFGLMQAHRPARIRGDVQEWFAPVEGPFFSGFGDWYGADVVVATGWQTAHPAMLLPGCRSRAYLVHDHESEFYATSVERLWAEESYRLGMHAICASPWLADLVGAYGATTSVFDFGVDHDVYFARDVPREPATIAMYGRDVTARRAVPLALFAVRTLMDRRPDLDLRVVSFGNKDTIHAPFDHEHLGVRSPDELARLYSQATVGLVLSLTNYSLIPKEMLACGLPCVDLAGISAEGIFGADGPVRLAEPDVVALADALEQLLTDRQEWDRRHREGLAFARRQTWDRAAVQVEEGLREAVRRRAHA